jgi:hypothetical protein
VEWAILIVPPQFYVPGQSCNPAGTALATPMLMEAATWACVSFWHKLQRKYQWFRMLGVMKTQSATDLFQYWNRLRKTMPAPRRTDIEPSDIKTVLGDMFILESPDQSADMRFRLAGTVMSNLFERPLRGTQIRNLFQEQHRPIISRLMRNCFQDGSVVLLGLDAVTQSGRHTLLEIIMLPLQNEAEGVRILGCMSVHQYQFWHGLEAIHKIDLHSIRLIDADREPLFLANRPEIPLPPTLAPYEEELQINKMSAGQRGLKLLVIQGGKPSATDRPLTKR